MQTVCPEAENSRSGRDFTLIELLVIITIIAILCSILLPVLAKASDKAKEAFCASSQKQIGFALNYYAADYNDWLPRHAGNYVGGWHYHSLFVGLEYFKNTNIFLCPSDRNPWEEAGAPKCSYALNFRTCGMIMDDSFSSGTNWVTLSKLAGWPKQLSGSALLTDNAPVTGAFFHPTLTMQYATPPAVVYGVTPRHANGANVLYADMHVKWVRAPFGGLTVRAWQFCPDSDKEW